MLNIIHGENIVKSRKKLFDLINSFKKKNPDSPVTRLEAKDLDLNIIQENVGSISLFKNKKLIIIEELHSLRRSKKKNEIIKYLNQSIAQSADNNEFILWEKRKLTKNMIKKISKLIKNCQVHHFKVTNHLFKFLDNFHQTKKQYVLQLLDKAIESDGEWMVFSMLRWKLRLLIESKEGSQVKGAPFMIRQLKKQARYFKIQNLLNLHQRLLRIDYEQKTGNNNLSLTQELNHIFI